MKNKCSYKWLALLVGLLTACGPNRSAHHEEHAHQPSQPPHGVWYTCPMPEDSVYQQAPGQCPKCGMDLVPMEHVYQCPMHPEVLAGEPGRCPLCGMPLKELDISVDPLEAIVQPTQRFVVSKLRPLTPAWKSMPSALKVEGYLTYDPNQASVLSARVAGRIDKLYVQANFQEVKKGQKLLEIYSPAWQAAQQEYLYLLKSADSKDQEYAKAQAQKLLLWGMDEGTLAEVVRTGKALPTVPLYAPASGHVHFLEGTSNIASHALAWPEQSESMDSPGVTGQGKQVIQVGEYVEKGDILFAIANQSSLWAVFKVKPDDISTVREGVAVEVEVNDEIHEGKVDLIERSFQDFYTLRVALRCDNHTQLKVGSLVKGTLLFKGVNEPSLWVPRAAVVYLGNGRSAVFVKQPLGYVAREVLTAAKREQWVEIVQGLARTDSIAPVAGYLVDSEAIIETEAP